MNNRSLSKEIKDANRQIYNRISIEDYNQNESIFNDKRKLACEKILQSISKSSGNERFLDIGTGTGNVLRIARNCFNTCHGVDIGEELLIKISNKYPDCFFSGSDAENLPFKDESFNCVSCYALLHHLYEHSALFSECFRVLKPGGSLYTDHDPNYFFNRFYHMFYKIRFLGRHGFGTEIEDLAEYHNVFSMGINPEKLKEILIKIGFTKVKIQYRFTDKDNWSPITRMAVKSLRLLSDVTNVKSLKSHFALIAVK